MNSDLTVQDLIEFLQNLNPDMLVVSRQYKHGSNTVTTKLLNVNDLSVDELLIRGRTTNVVVL